MQADAPEQDVRHAESQIREVFVKDLDALLRTRPDPHTEPGDDKTIFAMADHAIRQYHAATGREVALPRLSKVQYWEIRQRLYIMHSALGPLGELLSIEGVEDIHINGTRGGYLEFGDHQEPLPIEYGSEDELVALVRYYAEQAGKRFDIAHPMVTITLRDGSRLNAVHPPIAQPLVVTVRKQQLRRFLSLQTMADVGAIPSTAIRLLHAAVRARLNILIAGPTGSGKTTLARIFGMLVPAGERTCVLETERELWLHELREQDMFSLEEREANVEGAGRLTMQELFQQAALRQRPKRIIVGEVRGGEALDMLHAMTSGHDGSFTTLHASGPRSALDRLETLALEATSRPSSDVVRRMIAGGVDLIVYMGEYHRGDATVRRLGSLAFVAENPEDSSGYPLVQEFCRYRIADDGWDWDAAGLSYLPPKIRNKVEVAGLDLAHLA
ncbi:MAG: CpaF family protein [Candidatus Dormibacteria bacterium]